MNITAASNILHRNDARNQNFFPNSGQDFDLIFAQNLLTKFRLLSAKCPKFCNKSNTRVDFIAHWNFIEKIHFFIILAEIMQKKRNFFPNSGKDSDQIFAQNLLKKIQLLAWSSKLFEKSNSKVDFIVLHFNFAEKRHFFSKSSRNSE